MILSTLAAKRAISASVMTLPWRVAAADCEGRHTYYKY